MGFVQEQQPRKSSTSESGDQGLALPTCGECSSEWWTMDCNKALFFPPPPFSNGRPHFQFLHALHPLWTEKASRYTEMHFERSLKKSIYPAWADQYIDYQKLKALLHDDGSDAGSVAGDDDWTEKDEEAFVEELINVQLEKVHHFQSSTIQTLRDRVAECETKLDGVAAKDKGKEDEVRAWTARHPQRGRVELHSPPEHVACTSGALADPMP